MTADAGKITTGACIYTRSMVNYKCCEEGWSSVTDVLRTSGAYQEENYERHHQRN